MSYFEDNHDRIVFGRHGSRRSPRRPTAEERKRYALIREQATMASRDDFEDLTK